MYDPPFDTCNPRNLKSFICVYAYSFDFYVRIQGPIL